MPCNTLVCLLKSPNRAGVYPENLGFRMRLSESVAVFDCDLRLPTQPISKILEFAMERYYPTPPMPSRATRLWV